MLLLIGDNWFEVQLAPLPPLYLVETVVDGCLHRGWKSDVVYDAVLRCKVQRHRHEHDDKQRFFYGEDTPGRCARNVYAVSKRQLSRREMESHGVNRKGSS